MDFEKKFAPLEKSRMRVEVKVGQKDVAGAYQNVLQKYAKTLQIPGFRKGKVPPSVIESKYRIELCNEAEGELIKEVFSELRQHGEKHVIPLAYCVPEVNIDMQFDPQQDFSFVAEYDVFPKPDINNIEGLEIEIPDVSIEEEDVQRELEELQDRNALITDKEEGEPAEKGDIATAEYVEFGEDGEEIKDSRRDDLVFTIGKDTLFADDEPFVNSGEFAVGMKIGETREVEKTFPEDYSAKEFAGKTIKIKLTLVALKKKELPALDDEFAQDVSEKYKTFDELKSGIRKDLELRLEDSLNKMRNDALLDKLIEANDFELPRSMIRSELEERWSETAERFGMDSEKLEKLIFSITGAGKKETLTNWMPSTIRNTKCGIIVGELLERMGIDIAPEEIEKEIEKKIERASEDDGITIDEAKEFYANSREKEYLIDEIKEQRLFDRLLEKCVITKGERQSYEEFLSESRKKKFTQMPDPQDQEGRLEQNEPQGQEEAVNPEA